MLKIIKGHIVANKQKLEGHISHWRGGETLPWYDGTYEITPHAYNEQIMQTANKSMRQNVTIHKVPKFDVDNPFGGQTISIATEV